MERQELTKTLLAAKKAKNLKWEDVAAQVKCAPVWIASVVHGQNSMNNVNQAIALCDALGFTGTEKDSYVKELTIPPLKMQLDWDTLKQDPTVYRLHEVMLIYGESLCEIIHEKFGAGIMSAIDVMLDVDKVTDHPDGDRVKITISGKYLKFREW